MADAKQLVDELAALGVKVELNDGKIKFGPKSKVTPEMLLKMREQREQLIAYLGGEAPSTSAKENTDAMVGLNPQASQEATPETGLRRLPFFLICVCIPVVFAVGDMLDSDPDKYPYETFGNWDGRSTFEKLFSGVRLWFRVLILIPAYFRLINMNIKTYLVVLLFVPFLDVFILGCLLFAPEAEIHKKKAREARASNQAD